MLVAFDTTDAHRALRATWTKDSAFFIRKYKWEKTCGNGQQKHMRTTCEHNVSFNIQGLTNLQDSESHKYTITTLQ